MKQFLRLWSSYCLKRTQAIDHIYKQYASDKRNICAVDSQTRPAFLRTFFLLSPDICYGLAKAWLTRRYKIVSHRMDRGYRGDNGWQNKVRRKSGKGMSAVGKAQPIPCFSPPSLTLPSGPIPICPAYTSVKRPVRGTLAKGKRLHSGRKAHTETPRMGHGSVWDDTRGCLPTASELGASLVLTPIGLVLVRPNQGTNESKPRPKEDQTELPSHSQESSMTDGAPSSDKDGVSKVCPKITQWINKRLKVHDRYGLGTYTLQNTRIRGEGNSFDHGLEQQSNTSRRNPEESCVCTLAMAPARSGLGLALGMTLFFLFTGFSGLYAQPSAQRAMETDSITPLQIGDTIPEALWHLPLQVVNHPAGRDTITLDDYRDKKLIMIVFWAAYCKPCIQTIQKLDSVVSRQFNTEAAVLPVFVYDGPQHALPFMKKRGWQFPSVINDQTLNKIAFARYITGFGSVWIGNGKLIAVPRKKSLTLANIESAVSGLPPNVENLPEQPLNQ